MVLGSGLLPHRSSPATTIWDTRQDTMSETNEVKAEIPLEASSIPASDEIAQSQQQPTITTTEESISSPLDNEIKDEIKTESNGNDQEEDKKRKLEVEEEEEEREVEGGSGSIEKKIKLEDQSMTSTPTPSVVPIVATTTTTATSTTITTAGSGTNNGVVKPDPVVLPTTSRESEDVIDGSELRRFFNKNLTSDLLSCLNKLWKLQEDEEGLFEHPGDVQIKLGEMLISLGNEKKKKSN